MILRLSDKLSKRIGIRPIESLPLSANPFADWSSHLFAAGRLEYVLTANTVTLYSVVFPAHGIKRDMAFCSQLFAQVRSSMIEDGFEFHYKRLIDADVESVTYSKAFNRSVSASIGDIVELCSYSLEVEMKSPEDAARTLNAMPLSVIGHATPREAFQHLSFRG